MFNRIYYNNFYLIDLLDRNVETYNYKISEFMYEIEMF